MQKHPFPPFSARHAYFTFLIVITIRMTQPNDSERECVQARSRRKNPRHSTHRPTLLLLFRLQTHRKSSNIHSETTCIQQKPNSNSQSEQFCNSKLHTLTPSQTPPSLHSSPSDTSKAKISTHKPQFTQRFNLYIRGL